MSIFDRIKNSIANKKKSKKYLSLKSHELQRMPYFYSLMSLIKNIDGDIVECGVGRGNSLAMMVLSSELINSSCERSFYGFDSFEGFPSPTEEDLEGKAKKGHYKVNIQTVKDLIKNYLTKSSGKIFLEKGFVEDTLEDFSNKIALLHLDLDLYNAYKFSLYKLYPLVSKGGVIAFDEYQSTKKWPGAKKAIDEFISKTGEKLVHSEIIDRYFIIKGK